MKVLPLYNVLVLPHSNIFFQTQAFRAMAGNNIYQGDEVTILVLRDQQTREEMNSESFYPIGVEGVVEEISTDGYVVVQTAARVDVHQVLVNENREIFVETTKRADIMDMDPAEAHMKLAKIKEGLREMVSRFRFGDMMRTYIDQYSSIEEAASVLSSWLTLSNEERYSLLQEDSMKKRFERLEQIIYEYSEVAKVTSDAQSAQQEDYQKAYGDTPFGLLIRKIAKLDHDAAMAVFSEFINDQSLNQKQIAFVNKIISYIENNGYMENTDLMKPPFDKPVSFIKLFDPKRRTEILQKIQEVKENAVKIEA